uniref:BZIP domain-containing protein n=1 Tax=Lotharella oceanica TaxID=641309 RepID=A0A7S2U132_9EUKA
MSSPMPLDRLGNKRISSGSRVTQDDPDKTSKRKARKAEVARACRKRKKAYILSLEQKAAVLQRKLAEMTGNTGQSKCEDEAHRQEQNETLMELERLVVFQHPDTKEIKRLVTKFVSKSREHQALFWRQIDNTKKSITPGAQAKFALWGLDQDDEFYSKPGLWKTLMTEEIGLDDIQVRKLMRVRQNVREAKSELLDIQNKLVELRKAINIHLSKRHKLIDRLMETLKPLQAARFFLWVSKNSSCMQMLQTVWKMPEENDGLPETN